MVAPSREIAVLPRGDRLTMRVYTPAPYVIANGEAAPYGNGFSTIHVANTARSYSGF